MLFQSGGGSFWILERFCAQLRVEALVFAGVRPDPKKIYGKGI